MVPRIPDSETSPTSPSENRKEAAGRESNAEEEKALNPSRLQGAGIHRTWDGEPLPRGVCILLSTMPDITKMPGWADQPEVVKNHHYFLDQMVPLVGEAEAKYIWQLATTRRGGVALSPKLRAVPNPEMTEDQDDDGWPAGLDDVPIYAPINWDQAWDEGQDPGFLVPYLLPRGRVVSLNAEAKDGKSLLLLDMTMGLTTAADKILGVPNPNSEPVRVMYVDWEMSEADLVSRLHDLGYGKADYPETLFYTHGSGLALTTQEGADQLLATAKAHRAELVVIDTLIAALDGSENDSEVIRPLHRATSDRLKRAGVTVAWADHTGHKEKGRARGTGDKQAAIDLAWSLRKKERPGQPDLLKLKATHTRTSLPHRELEIERVSLQGVGFLEHSFVGLPGQTGGVAVITLTTRQDEIRAEMDQAGFPWTDGMGRPKAKRWMLDHYDPNWGVRAADLAGVLKWAKDRRYQGVGNSSRNSIRDDRAGNSGGNSPEQVPPEHPEESRHDGTGTGDGNSREQPDPAPLGNSVPPHKGGTVPVPGSERDFETDKNGVVLFGDEEDE